MNNMIKIIPIMTSQNKITINELFVMYISFYFSDIPPNVVDTHLYKTLHEALPEILEINVEHQLIFFKNLVSVANFSFFIRE